MFETYESKMVRLIAIATVLNNVTASLFLATLNRKCQCICHAYHYLSIEIYVHALKSERFRSGGDTVCLISFHHVTLPAAEAPFRKWGA